MASFPHQVGQVQYAPYVMPTSEAMPSQVIIDPSIPPTFQGTGPCGVPYNSSVGYHSCCNHMPFPGHYGYGPSVPHPYPLQPSPWWGSYPAYPHAMPFHFAPPPHPSYAADISRFEHDKNAVEPQNNHCCGCPNHVCKPWGMSGVKIEEQEPSFVKDKDLSKGGVQSFVPSDFKNCPYPIIWMPPEHLRNLEQKNPSMPKIEDTEETPLDVNLRGKSSQKALSGRSLLPAAMENHGLRMPRKDSQAESHQQTEDKGKEFSYPIFWIPYANQEENVRDHKNTSPIASSLVFPSDKISRSQESMPDGEYRGKIGQHLVKQHPEEKMPVKNEESAAGDIQEKDARKKFGNVSGKGEDTKGEGSKGRKSPVSHTGKLKLPPVCLRVDPLPRKKNGNKTLRSPSPQNPYGEKDAQEGKELGLANDKIPNPPVKRKEVKVIEVKDSPTGEEKVKISSSITKEDRGSCEDGGKGTEKHETGDIPKKNDAGEGKMEERKEKAARLLSSDEAATLIQAVYRGFEVRRWEQRKKLKQMARIHNEVNKIKNSIQELQSSYDSLGGEKGTKQEMVIGESIMSLLLSLDTIQGLHPSLRDIRKALARELIAMQEQLDSLASSSGESMDQQSYAVLAAGMHMDSTPEDSTEKDPLRGEAITECDESNAAEKVVEQLKLEHPDAEASTLSTLAVESSGNSVAADLDGQELARDDVQCKESDADKSVEFVSQLVSSKDVECEPPEDKTDEELAIVDPMPEQKSTVDSEKPVVCGIEHDQELQDNEEHGATDDYLKCTPTQERNCQQEHLNGKIEDNNLMGDAQKSSLPQHEEDLPGDTEETIAAEVVKDERTLPDMVNQKLRDDDDVVEVPVALFGEGESTLLEGKVIAPEQGKDKAFVSDAVSGIEEHAEDEAVIPASLHEQVECTMLKEEATPPEEEDETTSPAASNTKLTYVEEEFVDKTNGSTGDRYVEDQEIGREEKHEHSDLSGVVTDATETVMKCPEVTEPPEKEEDCCVWDEGASIDTAMKKTQIDRVDELLHNQKLMEDNEQLRMMMQKLMDAGKEQLDVISSLTGRVKELEKKLAKSKKARSRQCRMARRLARVKENVNSTPGNPC